MNTRSIGGVFRIVLGLLCIATLGGCGGPQNGITIVNNVRDISFDIDFNGYQIKKDLKTGESFTYYRYCFSHGQRMTLTARGHWPDGEYAGVLDKTFYLTSGYYGPEHRFVPWIIDRIEQPTEVRRGEQGTWGNGNWGH